MGAGAILVFDALFPCRHGPLSQNDAANGRTIPRQLITVDHEIGDALCRPPRRIRISRDLHRLWIDQAVRDWWWAGPVDHLGIAAGCY